ITGGPKSTLPVSLAIAPNVYGATLACSRGLTVPAVAGVAVFTGCSISKAGIGLRLVASAEGADDVWSFPINVWPAGSPRGPDLEMAELTGFGLTWGRPVEFSIHVRQTAPGQQLSDRRIQVQLTDSPADPETWRTIGGITTDAKGAAM